VAHYNRRMANGERVERPRLVYSMQNDVVFCFCCKRFSHECRSVLIRDVTRDWNNLCHLLSSHDKSHDHLDGFQRWKELEIRLVSKQTDDLMSGPWIAPERKHC
jgi:hypothetical protein